MYHLNQEPKEPLTGVRNPNPFKGLETKIHLVLEEISLKTKMIQEQSPLAKDKAEETPQTEIHKMLLGILSHAEEILDRLV